MDSLRRFAKGDNYYDIFLSLLFFIPSQFGNGIYPKGKEFAPQVEFIKVLKNFIKSHLQFVLSYRSAL